MSATIHTASESPQTLESGFQGRMQERLENDVCSRV